MKIDLTKEEIEALRINAERHWYENGHVVSALNKLKAAQKEAEVFYLWGCPVRVDMEHPRGKFSLVSAVNANPATQVITLNVEKALDLLHEFELRNP